MRKHVVYAGLLIGSLGSIAASCKKERVLTQPVPNSASVVMTLHDKPLDTIKRYISGRWQLISREGGFSGGDKHTYTNTFVTFTGTDWMTQTEDGKTTINARITWEKTQNIHTGGTSYIMTAPVMWKMNSLQHDTLYTDDNAYDGYGYLLVRSQ